jgi:Putative esterase
MAHQVDLLRYEDRWWAIGDIMALDVVSQSRCFDGTQFTYQHPSSQTGTAMRFAVFIPPQANQHPVPVVWYLSGLTCTEENFTVKAGAQRIAAELGLLLIAPDTSPRGDGVPGDPAGSYDFGLGAGFYVDATQEPWSRNYRMATYVERELPALVKTELPADMTRHVYRRPSPLARAAVRDRNRSIDECQQDWLTLRHHRPLSPQKEEAPHFYLAYLPRSAHTPAGIISFVTKRASVLLSQWLRALRAAPRRPSLLLVRKL